jgi:hypothetical protein
MHGATIRRNRQDARESRMKNEHPFHETLTHRWSGHGAGAVISAPIEPNGPECPARFEACCSLRAVACLGSILLTTVLALPAPVEAAPAWRCGNAYSDTPCPGGRRIDAIAAPDEGARRAADEATRRIEARADAMERDRLHAEQALAARNDRLLLAQQRLAMLDKREHARRQGGKKSGSGKRGGGRHATGDSFVAQAAGTGSR